MIQHEGETISKEASAGGGGGGGGGGNPSIQEETMRMVQLLGSFSAGAVTNNYLPISLICSNRSCPLRAR